MTEHIDPTTLNLLSELQDAYQNKGPTVKGPDAERYHRALRAYVDHLHQDGGVPQTLRATLAWYDKKRGCVESEQLALL